MPKRNPRSGLRPFASIYSSLPAPRLRKLLSLSLATIIFASPLGFTALAQEQPIGLRQPADAERSFDLKSDKLLKFARSEEGNIEELSNVIAVRREADGEVKVGVVVELAGQNAGELKAAGFPVGAVIGDVATVETDVNRLPELASLASVRKISASTFRYPLNDRARQSVGIDNSSGQRVVSQTGRGVVVGIIDSGIDFRHPDFTKPGSGGKQTRIKAMLDMTPDTNGDGINDWDYTSPTGTGFIGKYYTEAQINSALAQSSKPSQTSDIVRERDSNGHGTHVAGTAAGNGLGAPTAPGVYAGMAPEADLIIVKASRQNDGNASFGTTDVINALSFIQAEAAKLGEPFVINMSLGGQSGPHDGTNPDERAIDNLTSTAGRAVCVAAGNEGSDSIHASTTVPAGGSVTLHFNATSKPSLIDLYSAPRGTSSSGRYTVTVTEPDGTVLGPLSFDANGFSQSNGQLSDTSVRLWNALDDKGDSDPTNDQADVFMLFKSGAQTGTWTIKLDNGSGEPASTFDAWSDGGNVSFADFVDNNSHLVSSPGTSRGAITVGAFVTRSASLLPGSFAPFTSPGPTADGRVKPEISAPGYYLYSSKSSDINSTNGITSFTYGTGANALASGVDQAVYGGLAGTSMATPVVTGSVALMLQANPGLTNSQIKSYIMSTAAHDSFDPAGWSGRFGFGKLNIAAAITSAANASAGTPTVRFALSDFPVVENSAAGFVTISVIREGDPTGAAQVSFATSDTSGLAPCSQANTGKGSERCDYATSLGTVNWAAGESGIKSFNIPIVDDSLVEGNESFNVTLSKASGVSITSPNTATVTILDNDSAAAATANPIDGVDFFITQQYIDFLGRLPDAGGFANWKTTLGNCPNGGFGEFDNPSCDRIHVAAGFFQSDEFLSRGYFAFRFYEVAFGRRPNYAEFIPDMATVGGPKSPAEEEAAKTAFANAFVQRTEFTNKYGSASGQALANQLLQTAGLPANSYNASGQTNGQILRGIAESQAALDKFLVDGTVSIQYFGFLRRDPDPAGYQNNVNTLRADPNNLRHLIFIFIYSSEYRGRFGNP